MPPADEHGHEHEQERSRDEDEGRETRKRPRLVGQEDPIKSHRHYCPHVCGIVRNYDSVVVPPLWRALLTRTMKAKSSVSSNREPGDITTAADVRRLLRPNIGDKG